MHRYLSAGVYIDGIFSEVVFSSSGAVRSLFHFRGHATCTRKSPLCVRTMDWQVLGACASWKGSKMGDFISMLAQPVRSAEEEDVESCWERAALSREAEVANGRNRGMCRQSML